MAFAHPMIYVQASTPAGAEYHVFDGALPNVAQAIGQALLGQLVDAAPGQVYNIAVSVADLAN